VKKIIRGFLFLLGIGLIIFGFATDYIGMSKPGFIGIGQLYVFTAGGVFICLGLMMFFSYDKYKVILKGFRGKYVSIAIILLNTIIIIFIIEMYFVVPSAFRHMRFGLSEKPIENFIVLNFLPDHHATRGNYKSYPFVGYRHHPYKSKETNVNERGIRFTPGAVCNDKAKKVFVFGGSTVYGNGVPDWETIPYYLQKELSQSSKEDICVTNYGNGAWISTQSLIMLILEIQEGRIPDLVIFYSGLNDTMYEKSGHPLTGLFEQEDEYIKERHDTLLTLKRVFPKKIRSKRKLT